MSENKYWNKVDTLFDSLEVYHVDFLPHAVEGENLSLLDDYFLPEFQKRFPQAITNVVLKTFYYKKAVISSTVWDESTWYCAKDMKPNEFEKTLNKVFSSDRYRLYVYYPDENVLVFFPGEKTLQIYGLNGDFQRLLNALVQCEGMFLVRQPNYFPPGYSPENSFEEPQSD